MDGGKIIFPFGSAYFQGLFPKNDTSKPTLSSDVGKFLGVKDLHIQLPNHLADHGTLALRRHCRRTPEERCLWCWYCRSCQGWCQSTNPQVSSEKIIGIPGNYHKLIPQNAVPTPRKKNILGLSWLDMNLYQKWIDLKGLSRTCCCQNSTKFTSTTLLSKIHAKNSLVKHLSQKKNISPKKSHFQRYVHHFCHVNRSFGFSFATTFLSPFIFLFHSWRWFCHLPGL